MNDARWMANRLFPSSSYAIFSELSHALAFIKLGCLHALWIEHPLRSFLLVSSPINYFVNKQSCATLPFWNYFSCLWVKPESPYRAVNTFHMGYKNQSVYAVSGTSRFLFSEKYKTHKYSVGRAYSC